MESQSLIIIFDLHYYGFVVPTYCIIQQLKFIVILTIGQQLINFLALGL